jgi:hypothetical protein
MWAATVNKYGQKNRPRGHLWPNMARRTVPLSTPLEAYFNSLNFHRCELMLAGVNE